MVYALALIGVVYLMNPTAGLLELIPDVIPGIGNLDESLAVMLIIAGIVEATEGKKYRAQKKKCRQSCQPPRRMSKTPTNYRYLIKNKLPLTGSFDFIGFFCKYN